MKRRVVFWINDLIAGRCRDVWRLRDEVLPTDGSECRHPKVLRALELRLDMGVLLEIDELYEEQAPPHTLRVHRVRRHFFVLASEWRTDDEFFRLYHRRVKAVLLGTP